MRCPRQVFLSVAAEDFSIGGTAHLPGEFEIDFSLRAQAIWL
jgi:hypothetical protein